jgi:hypothetical protein
MKSADVCSVYTQQNWEMLLRFPVFTFDEFPEKKSDDTLIDVGIAVGSICIRP